MAYKLSEFQKRVLTGIFGVSLVLALIAWGGVGGTLLIALVLSLGMMAEFVEMTFVLPDRKLKRVVLLITTFLLGFLYALSPQKPITLIVIVFMGLFGFFLFTANRYDGAAFLTHCQELMYSVFGLVYLALLPLFLPELRRLANGRDWVVLFLLIVWSADTGAYFVGKKWGRTKLYPKVSPKKTVEGSVGGLFASLLIALLFKAWQMPQLSWAYVSFLALFVSAVSQVGDLCESLLKRAFDKKDSGSWLPGHGGFLDRFDSVVFSLPIMYAWIRIF